MKVWILLCVLLPTVLASWGKERDARAERCCPGLGCFNNNKPFDHMPAPICPEEINPTFSLYVASDPSVFQRITRDSIPPNFQPNKRTVFIVHGWMGSKDWLDWIYTMKDAFLHKHDFNIVLVDWTGGSVDIWYPQSAANTRTVGAEINLVMSNLINKGGASWNNMYCIGHSLGAHTCGFAGKRGGQLQRITGLDPAGPWFKDSAPEARLDASDATFVDNIHSDGNRLLLALGIGKPIGDLDFFPNGNRIMPGCITRTKTDASIQGLGDLAACSHHRAIHYFTESLQSDCKFKAAPCASNEDADDDKCNKCSGNQCQFMGYEAEVHPGRGTYFTKTNDISPYCLGN